MIQFANPVWLWGLLGLLIPVSIHLLSRKEGKVIPIGSLRHLKASDTAQFSSIRLNEILLLLLRCLLIALVVLMLAGPTVKQTDSSGKKWLLLESGIEREQVSKPLIDSLSAQGYELRCLAKNFPLLEDSVRNDQSVLDYWALVETLAAKPWHDVVVLSHNYIRGFKGKRQPIPDNIRWITYEPIPGSYLAKAVTVGNDSVWMRTAQTSGESTILKSTHESMAETSVEADKADTIKISLFYDMQFDHDAKILEACLRAIQTIIPDKIIIIKKPTSEYQPVASGWTIWLAAKAPPLNQTSVIAFSDCAGNLQPIILSGKQADGFCDPLARTIDWLITRRLSEEAALNENLSLTLASILLSGRYGINDERDKRQLPEKATWATLPENANQAGVTGRSTLEGYFAIVLLLCLIAERWLAFKRNQ